MVNIIPQSHSGKWAVILGVIFVVSTALSLLFAAAIGGDSTVIANSSLLSMLAAALSVVSTLAGLLSLIAGVYATIKHKEWLVFKLLGALYLLTFIIFMLGELLFPH